MTDTMPVTGSRCCRRASSRAMVRRCLVRRALSGHLYLPFEVSHHADGMSTMRVWLTTSTTAAG